MYQFKKSLNEGLAIVTVLCFILTAVVNGLVSTGISVSLTNTDISDTHPVYAVPNGRTFIIWSIIYALVAAYTVLQAFPAQHDEPSFVEARPYAIATLLLNVGWLYCFSFELYWISLIVIAAYALALLKCVAIFDVNMLDRDRSWKIKLAGAAFSCNGAWVCVATCLQFCVNLMDEGWIASPDFTTGILFSVTLLACYNVFQRGDVVYAFVSAWALGGIIANQSPDSKFGMASQICNKVCLEEKLNICRNGLWKGVCASYSEDNDFVIVPKSEKVIAYCWFAIVLVLLAFIAGMSRSVYQRMHGGFKRRSVKVISSENSTSVPSKEEPLQLQSTDV